MGRTFSELEAIAKELGIIVDKDGIVKEQAHRLVVADEKGFSQHSDNVCN